MAVANPTNSNKQIKETANCPPQIALCLAICFALLIVFLLPNQAKADYAEVLGGPSTQTLRNPLIPGASFANPYQAAPIGQAPACGDGPVPAPLIPGDLGAPMPPPSGMADFTHGNIFPTRTGPNTRYPSIYQPGSGRHPTMNGQSQGVYEDGNGNGGQGTYESGTGNGGKGTFEGGAGNGGKGTFEGGAGNGGTGTYEGGGGNGGTGTYEGGEGSNGKGTYEGGGGNGGTGTYEGGGGNGGEKTTDSEGGNGGQRWINNGGPRGNAEKESDTMLQHNPEGNAYDFQGPLPTVRTFSRYLVILGVVAATIFIALAAWSMVFGSPYGGARVIGAAGGLILLLMGYTIWKVVQMNTFMHDRNAGKPGGISRHRDGTPQQLNGRNAGGGNQNNNGPFLPGG